MFQGGVHSPPRERARSLLAAEPAASFVLRALAEAPGDTATLVATFSWRATLLPGEGGVALAFPAPPPGEDGLRHEGIAVARIDIGAR